MKQGGATEPSILSIRRGLAEKVKLSGYDAACTTITQGRNAMYKEYTRPLEQQIDTDKNIFIVFDAKNESKTATGHTIEEAIAHLKQLN